jgi:gamma-glutamylcyclotransferase (GGCT)/AIG2-like uncharacterized protein YtfP
MYYFAYGANMSEEEMMLYCPKARFIARARLPAHSFVYDNFTAEGAESWGNVIPSSEEEVWGALYEISDKDFAALEKKEGCPVYYQPKIVRVFDDESSPYEASLFMREGKCRGVPSDRYRARVLDGAKSRLLPPSYIERFLSV